MSLGPAVFDRDVSAVDVTAVFQTLLKRLNEMCAFAGRTAVEVADEGNWGLRVRNEGPCKRRTGQPHRKLAPPHRPSRTRQRKFTAAASPPARLEQEPPD